jgi:hypothetical protein
MNSFRYRTSTLLGPWRHTAEEASKDAIRAKQACRNEQGEGWHWIVPGSIEERQELPDIYSRNDNFAPLDFNFTPREQRRA